MKIIIETRDLKKSFKVGKNTLPVLRGVDLRVREGEFLAIMGPSGCGKSTLLYLLGGLLQPSSGSIVIDGVDITRLSDSERTALRRQRIGYVFQRFNLLPALTARENIELAKRIHGNGFYGPERVEEILTLLGLREKMNHRPNELSVGEQQRVAIARAIINNPKIILADEPTGSLDSENSRMVLRMLQELNSRFGQTLVMITHDPDIAAMAHRIEEMRDGKILHRIQDYCYDLDCKGLF